MHRLSSGFVLSSRYQLIELVASGGMGQVWAATDEVLERKVALKVTHPQELQKQALLTEMDDAATISLALRITPTTTLSKTPRNSSAQTGKVR